jgi:hypothetical protein
VFGGAGPAIGNHWGIGSLLDIVDDAARVKMRDSAQKATDALAQRMLYGLVDQGEKHNGWEADVIYWDDMKLKSFKEKLQEEIDEWLEKVLD